MASPELTLDALHEWARIESQVVGRPASPAPPASWRRAQGVLGALGVTVVQLGLLAVLPFFVLVRGSLFLYAHGGYGSWLALVGGAGSTLVIVTAYAAWLSHLLTRRASLATLARRVALPLVLAYCGYALIYLSSVNAKADRVRAYYTSLHPLLRVALSTWILVDRDIVITDLARRREDYATMRLPVYDGSLHFLQRDGYVHAADLRVLGRSEMKNRLVQLYFWSMGLGTLRHVGTADHLHVELPLP